MTAAQDPRAWRIATVLAHATGLDWAQWAMGLTAPCTCRPHYGTDGYPSRLFHNNDCVTEEAAKSRGCHGLAMEEYRRHRATPVPAPWDTEAYLADCRRREIVSGLLPSLHFGNIDIRIELQDGKIAWDVRPDETLVRVGSAVMFTQHPWSNHHARGRASFWTGRHRASMKDILKIAQLGHSIEEASQ